ncbi:ATP-dependent helicase [Acholeplasma oculi]|uniref:DEAD/DEAH box helicase n=1 Tax=Acholeplasma oculi TaxID=35623 RepID=UPI000E184499|nr:DEAD/DEAH box helicase [Acholeplasma oculi]SUT88685.1 ATP-dependent helicase [Acholeplasma oculi]
MRKNPLEQSKYIKEEFSKYVKSTFILNNEKYSNDFSEELENSVLTKGPFLKLELPFQKSFSLEQLIKNGTISSLFKNIMDINLNQQLYEHQYESILRIIEKDNIVVTTGTGSGKTESFLYPILNELFKKIQKEGKLQGIQAILLYPMNALVNDQLERLRKILNNIPQITFGYFTGDTPPTYRCETSKGNYVGINREQFIIENFDTDEIKPPINELLTRDEIRNNPPNILITNYSMLEYLLVRPKDSAVLNQDSLMDWSFMVLDEAHTYRGILATEVSHLLKRLQVFAMKTPQFILTSATLGSTLNDKKNIVDFAEKLTSSKFYEKDIIYSKRVFPTIYATKYQIDPKHYSDLLNRINDKKSYDDILSLYNANDLFELLSADKNVHFLSGILKNTKSFEDALFELKGFSNSLNIENFISLITLITQARSKSGLGIYDIKYHFFVRTLEGAFVSLNPDAKLRITNRQKIDDMWAFEIAVCKNCNEMYIVGKEHEGKLFRSELDLYENYEHFEDLRIEFYLIKADVLEKIDDPTDNLIEYLVCSKCGKIHEESQHLPSECNCGQEYKVRLLKINKDQKEGKTNLTECVICGKTSHKTGILNSFRLGKDQSTALLSQILLKSMENSEESGLDEKQKDKVNIFEKPKYNLPHNHHNKQFLAFSDSRQQASFYALFFQETQNKFTRKALLLKHSITGPINQVISKIERTIHDYNLFKDNEKIKTTETQQAYITVLLELFKSDGVNSLEGLGLLSFEPILDSILEQVSEDNLKEYLPKVNINQLKDLLCIFTDIFRSTPAIKYDESGLTQEDKKEYLEYRRFDNYVKLKLPRKYEDLSVKSLLPKIESNPNNLTRYLKKAYSLSTDEVNDYSEKLWNLLSHGLLIQQENSDGRSQIELSSYKIINGKDSTWYQCNKCKTLTTHNINNVCIKGDCSGTLNVCDPDVILKDNFYRNEYLSRKINSIVVQEHTGQITREQGRKYQKEFKSKQINVLSSSTTFEMGVNIGSLDTVLMRNVPPTNANYAQRAGRAGRSDESVAFVLTYANHNSHDQIYFNDPIPMIEGKINPPHFKLDNKKIVIRHIMAYCIGTFYRSDNFEQNLSTFISDLNLIFKDYLDKNKEYIEGKIKNILNNEMYEYFKNFRWFEEIFQEDSLMNKFIIKVKSEISILEDAEERSRAEKRYLDAGAFKKQREELLAMGIVDALAKYNVIPGYGFPINVVPLKVFDRAKEQFNKSLDLTRDLSVAISEYAPDSEVVVDKIKYTSRYIILPKEGRLTKYHYYRCENKDCGKTHVSLLVTDDYHCELCESETKHLSFIEPNLGFINDDKNKESSMIKPKKTYSSEITYLGTIEPYNADLNINDLVLIQQTTDDRLLIINENPFFYCTTCGYAKLDKEKRDLFSYDLSHKTFKGKVCHNTKIEQTKLGHIVSTDVIKVRINMNMDFDTALSTLTAITNGITAHLQIDFNDINGVLVRDGLEKYAFVFYDTTYGGAGNVKQLLNKDGLISILERSLFSVSNNCCNEEVSCTNCLRNYRNSRSHKFLIRKKAKDALSYILSNI